MAGSIVEVTRERAEGGRLAFEVLFIYDIDPIEMQEGVNLPITPSSGLPKLLTDYGKVTEDEVAGFDNGTMVWWGPHPVFQEKGESLGEVLARAQREYEAVGRTFLRDIQVRYSNTGGRFPIA